MVYQLWSSGWLDLEIAQWVQHGELNQRLITQRVATLELHLTGGGGCGWLDLEIAQWVQHGELNQRLITQRVATLELHLTVAVGVAGWI